MSIRIGTLVTRYDDQSGLTCRMNDTLPDSQGWCVGEVVGCWFDATPMVRVVWHALCFRHAEFSATGRYEDDREVDMVWEIGTLPYGSPRGK